MKKVGKVLKKIFSIFCSILFVFSILMTVMTITQSRRGKAGEIFGYNVFVVATDSMNPTLKVNDLFIAKSGNSGLPKVALEEGESKEYAKGTGLIITYRSQSGALKGELITHRLEKISNESGNYIYYCRGDKDGAPLDNGITKDAVVATYVRKVETLSFVYHVVSHPAGFICLVIMPILTIFGSEVYKIAKEIKKPENSEEIDIEDEKKKYLEKCKEDLMREIDKDNRK